MKEHEFSSPRLIEALEYAMDAHAGVMRTGTDVPYITHPIAVAQIVRDAGGDENQQIAALLHDVVEDAGGQARLRDIEARFGSDVSQMVEACTDFVEAPGRIRPDWWERKAGYLRKLATEDPRAALVTAADKLHNCSAILADSREVGDAIWDRFSSGRKGQLWYYQELASILPMRLASSGPGAREVGQRLQVVVSDVVACAIKQVGRTAIMNDLTAARARSNRLSHESSTPQRGGFGL